VALKSDGTVVSWGAIGYDLGQNNVPAGLSGVKAISAGAYHTLALKSDGTVVAWGWNGYGQTDVPAGLSGVTAVSAGFRFSAALKSDGTVVVWGGEGQASIPPGLNGVTAVAANAYDIQALKSDGTVVAWGANANGAAIVPAGLTGVTAIAAGGFHTLGLVASTSANLSRAVQELRSRVNAANFSVGVTSSLNAKLTAAIAAFDRGQTNAAVNQLQAFQNEMRAQSGSFIPAGTANALISAAQSIIDRAAGR
jgi:hypothetical protein